METSKSTGNKLLLPAVAVLVIIVLAVGAGLYLTRGSSSTVTSTSVSTVTVGGGSSSVNTGSTTVINVVAAENFWGNLMSQLAGVHGNVTSVVSDPNTDPHDYQSNPANAKAIANAKLVVINGMNYDTWAQSLINASNTPGQVVINAQQVVGIKTPTRRRR